MRISEYVQLKHGPPKFWDYVDVKLPDELQFRFNRLDAPIRRAILMTGCGVEVECENVVEVAGHDDKHWGVVIDGSLRNNGKEFITRVGTRVCHQAEALQNFIKVAKQNKFATSDRTSIHVHINVLNLNFEHLNSLMILYAICEQAFFNYASAHRKHNIFCMPYESTMANGEYVDFKHMLQNAAKYSACNLTSVHEHGTVEFRHMETVYELAPIWDWIVILGLLKRFATVTPLPDVKDIVLALKRQSEYDQFLSRIFFNYASLLKYDPIDLDRAVSDAKLLFFKG